MRILVLFWDFDPGQVNINTFVKIPVLLLNSVRVVGVRE